MHYSDMKDYITVQLFLLLFLGTVMNLSEAQIWTVADPFDLTLTQRNPEPLPTRLL